MSEKKALQGVGVLLMPDAVSRRYAEEKLILRYAVNPPRILL